MVCFAKDLLSDVLELFKVVVESVLVGILRVLDVAACVVNEGGRGEGGIVVMAHPKTPYTIQLRGTGRQVFDLIVCSSYGTKNKSASLKYEKNAGE